VYFDLTSSWRRPLQRKSKFSCPVIVPPTRLLLDWLMQNTASTVLSYISFVHYLTFDIVGIRYGALAPDPGRGEHYFIGYFHVERPERRISSQYRRRGTKQYPKPKYQCFIMLCVVVS